jgi:hypothetical protein
MNENHLFYKFQWFDIQVKKGKFIKECLFRFIYVQTCTNVLKKKYKLQCRSCLEGFFIPQFSDLI